MLSQKIIQELAVTAELCGADMSEAAARVMCAELAVYSEREVLGALSRLRREHQGRFTLAAIITRLDDGRPGAEEAWAVFPKDESSSAAVTTEMQEAMSAAWSLIEDGDRIGARMAFKESYERIVSKNRAERIPVNWQMSLGHDKNGREPALIEAARKGLIDPDRAMKMLPIEFHERFCDAIGRPELLLSHERGVSPEGVKRVKQIIGQVIEFPGALSREESADRMAKLRRETGL
jgi:hypothetical protein